VGQAAVTPLVALQDVTYAYPDGTPALEAVTVAIAPAERVALLGPTGAGKSTLLQLLNGLLRPTAGVVRVGGAAVTDETVTAVRGRVGLVFQNPDDQLFLPSLLEDVAFGPLNAGATREAAAARAHAVLERLGLAPAHDRAAHHLSGGERRLAALATVLVSEPDLLALDEPSGDLDARSRRRLRDILGGRREALLVATHDLELVRGLCTRALVLVGGRVEWDGGLDTLLADRGLLERFGLVA
jgi:cobalt/nickel transport system ATP-binding protein